MKVTLSLKDRSENSSTKYNWNNKDVEEFRALIKSKKNIISRLDDEFLLSCLRARKYNLERALELVKKHYSVKRKYRHLFQTFDAPMVQRCLNCGIIGYLPNSDHLGRVINVGKVASWDISELNLTDIVSMAILYAELLLNNHLVQVNGVVVILDLLGLSIRQAMQLTPSLAYQTIAAGVGAYPLSYKEIHLVNINYLCYPLLSMALPFLPRKIRKRVHLHTSVDTLQKYISKEYLPSDLGGELEPTDFTHCSQELRSNEEFFHENEKYWI